MTETSRAAAGGKRDNTSSGRMRGEETAHVQTPGRPGGEMERRGKVKKERPRTRAGGGGSNEEKKKALPSYKGTRRENDRTAM